MKIIKTCQVLRMKGTYALWLWPAIYVSYKSYDAIKELDIQFNWLNITAVISFLSNVAYYQNPMLYTKEDYAEYLDKGEEEFLKKKEYDTTKSIQYSAFKYEIADSKDCVWSHG